MDSEIIVKTCIDLHKLNCIKENECVLYTALLTQYFKDKKINIKPHAGIIYNKDIDDSRFHMWLSYDNKKIDITAHKQGQFSTTSSVLNQVLEKVDSPANSIRSVYMKEEAIKNMSNINDFQKKILLSASKNSDLSLEIESIDRFIEDLILAENKTNEEFNSIYNYMKDEQIFIVN